jgi:membrane protease YdiL (CAAX protease family)
MVRAMPPLQEDPTFPVLSLIFVCALVWVLAGILVRTRRTASDNSPGSPPPATTGVSTDVYRAWDIVVVLCLFLLFAGNLLMLLQEKKRPSPLTPDTILSAIVILFLLAGFVTTVVTCRLSVVTWLGLRWERWRSVFWIAPISVLAIWGIFGGLIWAGYMDWMEAMGVETMQESVRALQNSENPAILGWMTFAALVAAPLCEEVIFRGYCYPVLKKYSGAWTSMVTTSLVFACAHTNLPSAFPLFLLGMMLVYLYERTNSLWAPIAVHFLFNAATVTAQLYERWQNTPIQGPYQ